MPLWVARRPQRKGLWIQREGTKDKPDLVFYLNRGLDSGQLAEMISKQLESQGVRKEDHAKIVAKAEEQYEQRIKVEEAEKELKKLRAFKANGATLIQRGFKKWSPAYLPAIKRFEK